MKTILGQYDEYGYQIEDEKGRVLYTAGNSKYESHEVVNLDRGNNLLLKQIRSFCIKTAKEMANESGVEYGGVERCEMERGN